MSQLTLAAPKPKGNKIPIIRNVDNTSFYNFIGSILNEKKKEKRWVQRQTNLFDQTLQNIINIQIPFYPRACSLDCIKALHISIFWCGLLTVHSPKMQHRPLLLML